MRPDDLVAVVVNSPVTFVIAVEACQRGGIHLALFEAAPASEILIRQLVELAPHALVTDRADWIERLRRHPGAPRIVTLDPYGADAREADREKPSEPSRAGFDIAVGDGCPLVLFRTSGTTGDAKWVVHSQRTINRSVERTQALAVEFIESGIEGPMLSALAAAPRALFIGLYTISGFLQYSHCRAMGWPIVTSDRFLPREAMRLAARHAAGLLVTMPALLDLMIESAESRRLEWRDLAVVGLGGGALSPERARTVEERFGARLIQGYGSTELGGGVLGTRPFDADDVRLGTVGRPFPGVEVTVGADASSSARDGELWVHDDGGVALGMVVRNGRHARLEPVCDEGWVRTGDVGHRRGDGNFVIRGRVDSRFQLGDRRCYPEEIESVLAEHDGVARVRVRLRERRGASPTLVAEVQFTRGEVTTRELRRWCQDRLDAWKVPQAFESAHIAATMTGKTQRPRQTA